MRRQGFDPPGMTVDAGPARARRRADSGGPAAVPARGKSTELALIHVAKADPGMYEASAPYDQAPSPPAAEAELPDGAPTRTRESGARRATPSIRCANRAGGPEATSIDPREVYLFSRFFPSIPRYELY